VVVEGWEGDSSMVSLIFKGHSSRLSDGHSSEKADVHTIDWQ
jgi:hypothetical protein